MFANLPIHYEKVDTLTDEEKQCPACGTMMVAIGHEEIRTELRYTKAKLERIVYDAATYGEKNSREGIPLFFFCI